MVTPIGTPAKTQTILASQYEDGIYVGDLDNDSEDVCAISAYKMADAMLKARQE